MDHHEWLLKRNCSLRPSQLALAYALLFVLSLPVALVFTLLHGLWHVLAYALLEMAAVAIAFFHYARHAADNEHIALADDCLLIERVEAGQSQQVRLHPFYTRIAAPRDTQELMRLEARDVRIEVGRFVTLERRRQVALELRSALQGAGIRASP
mgnify:CR=1 FL=1